MQDASFIIEDASFILWDSSLSWKIHHASFQIDLTKCLRHHAWSPYIGYYHGLFKIDYDILDNTSCMMHDAWCMMHNFNVTMMHDGCLSSHRIPIITLDWLIILLSESGSWKQNIWRNNIIPSTYFFFKNIFGILYIIVHHDPQLEIF